MGGEQVAVGDELLRLGDRLVHVVHVVEVLDRRLLLPLLEALLAQPLQLFAHRRHPVERRRHLLQAAMRSK